MPNSAYHCRRSGCSLYVRVGTRDPVLQSYHENTSLSIILCNQYRVQGGFSAPSANVQSIRTHTIPALNVASPRICYKAREKSKRFQRDKNTLPVLLKAGLGLPVPLHKIVPRVLYSTHQGSHNYSSSTTSQSTRSIFSARLLFYTTGETQMADRASTPHTALPGRSPLSRLFKTASIG